MTRPPGLRASFERGDMIVDLFAGGGGASTGIEGALARSPDLAINHSPAAIAMHRANHPETTHYTTNVWDVPPREACAGRPVGLLWLSPDCTHFSRAKGGKPKSKRTRSLAWVAVRWAREVAPRVIVLENVEEFEGWGPLGADDQPDKLRAGRTFKAWLGRLRACGYHVEWRTLVAANYGTPTTRKRLFLVARRDGQRIRWPEPTHAKADWLPAASIIDWSLPCPSIFERPKPLVDATLRRIFEGVRRYVIECAEPFLVPAPFLVRTAHGDVDRYGKRRGRGQHTLELPLGTVTGSNDFALVAPVLASHYGNSVGRSLRAPAPTVTGGGQGHTSLVAALITKHYGGVVGHRVNRTLGTVTGIDHHALTTAFLTKFYGTSVGSDLRSPLPTVTANDRGGGHLAEVRAFLVSYYGTGRPAQLSLPMRTVTAKDRFGLVMVQGEPYEIADIGMRMLQPHELFAAQGFPTDYDITPELNGKPLSKTAQVELAGNSVCPQVARAIVAANLTEAA